MSQLNAWALAAAALLAAGTTAARDRAPPAAASLESGPAALLMKAREAREQSGCANAISLYRVVAAMGEGQEPAQHELGECLLLIDGATPVETQLFRQEAEFWLVRASFAGNARAQRALAVHFGSGANPSGSPLEALKWALVYARNRDAEVYGFKSLPPTFIPGLKAALQPGEIAAAEAFATGFQPLLMPKFEAPPVQRPKGSPPPPPERPSPGGRLH